MIYTYQQVAQAVQRAAILDPGAGPDAAILATAQALHLSVDSVLAVMRQQSTAVPA